MLLKALGWSLRDVTDFLTRNSSAPAASLYAQLEAIDHRIAQLNRVRALIAAAVRAIETEGSITPEQLLVVLKEIDQMEKYYTPEQLETLAKRRDALGEDGMAQANQLWSDLIERARAAREAGLDPASEGVRQIAAEWSSLVQAFTGGDPGILANLETAWRSEGDIHGVDSQEMRNLMEYLFSAP
jgi:hypothetical protein